MISGNKPKARIYLLTLLSIVLVASVVASCGSGSGLPSTVTFNEHVAPILYNNCTICHRPGGSAHFALVSYEDARKYGDANAYVTRQRIMPPWPADPHYTQFVGQRVLTEREIAMLEKWVKDGKPQGPANKLPSLPAYPVGSDVGTPDMRVPVQPYLLAGESPDKFLLVKVPFELPKDTFVSLIEFIPGRHNIVHHVNGDVVKYAEGAKTDVLVGERIVDMAGDTATLLQAYKRLSLPNDDGTYPVLQKSVVNYLPGVYGQRYPDGIGGYRLTRKGAFLLNDLHYGFNNGQAISDSSFINIFFSPVPPNRPVQEFQLGTLGVAKVEPDMFIQPDAVKKVWSKYTVPFDISILTVNPHMHLLGQSFKAYAVTNGGDTIRLISIPRWDFNWQYFYTFRKMVKVPAGATIIAEGIYDNTRKNLNNPFSPPRLVTDQNGSMKATDEMFQFIITYLPYRPGDENISLERK